MKGTSRFLLVTFPLAISLLGGGALTPTTRAQVVESSAAQRVAANWVRFILHHEGNWGGSLTASVAQVSPLERAGRLLGYHCRIAPRGYVLVSLLRQMPPVHDFGVEGDLNVALSDATADFLMDRLEGRLEAIEERLGPVAEASPEALESALGTRCQEGWEILARDPDSFGADLDTGVLRFDYQQGEELILTRWHQYPPYNAQCPEVPPGNPCTYDRCLVGCTALAAAEVFRFWAWPPFGVGAYWDRYDWANMPRVVTGASPSQQIAAVSELCAELGDAMAMYYCISEDGCGSYASIEAAKYALDTSFYYAYESDTLMRNDYPDDNVWFGLIKEQHNLNRPIEYVIPGHAIVVDGWMEVAFPLPEKWVHVCPGFADTMATWCLLDSILWSHGENELMFRNIYPRALVDHPLAGTYLAAQQPTAHWYVDRDNASTGATFGPGCQVQFLHRVTVTCTSPAGGAIRFQGQANPPTRVFTRGDPTKGVRLNGGELALYGGGSLRLR